MKKSNIITERGLLFVSLHGICRCLTVDNNNRARAFFVPFRVLSAGLCMQEFSKLPFRADIKSKYVAKPNKRETGNIF